MFWNFLKLWGWDIIALVCIIMHFFSVASFHLDVIKYRILRRVQKDMQNANNLPEVANFNFSERCFVYFVVSLILITSVFMVWVMFKSKCIDEKLYMCDYDNFYWIIGFVILVIFLYILTAEWKVICNEKPFYIGLHENSTLKNILLMIIEVVAFNVLFAEFIFKYI
jgi:hypothetical protein